MSLMLVADTLSVNLTHPKPAGEYKMVSSENAKEMEVREYVNRILGELCCWATSEFESEQKNYGHDAGCASFVMPTRQFKNLLTVARTLRYFPRDFLEVYWALSDAMQFADKCETALVSKDDRGGGGDGGERMCNEGNIRKEKRTALRFCLSGEVDCNDMETLLYIQEKLNSLFINSSVANNREYLQGEDYAKWCEDADRLAEGSNENATENDAENAAENN
jgi:hypothetical protein